MVAAELIVDAGPLVGSRFALSEGRALLVGRGDEADIRLLDLTVTDTHCSVAMRGHRAEITDLGSATGTFVNDRRVQSQPLEPGDVIRIGASQLRFAPVAACGSESAPADGGETSDAQLLIESRTWKGVRRRFNQSAVPASPEPSDGPRTARLRQRLAAICQMSNTVHGLSDLDRIVDVVAETVLTVSGAMRGAIIMKSPRTGEMETAVTRTRVEGGAEADFSVSRTILDEATQKGYSVLTGDGNADARFSSNRSIVLQGTQSVMCVPLKADERVLGAIYVEGSAYGGAFTEADLSLLAAVGYQAGLALDRVSLVADLERLFFGTLETLVAAIEAKDPYLESHARNVGVFAERMGKALDLPHHDLMVLRLGSMLHDIGKIGVPRAILLKEGRLDEEEMAEIRKHPEAGARIVSRIPRIERLVDVDEITSTIRHHHERWDGDGYPARLAGEAIPLAARILAVADTYDAVTHERPYHSALSPEEGAALLREVAGTQLDARLVAVFLELFERGEMTDPAHPATASLTGARGPGGSCRAVSASGETQDDTRDVVIGRALAPEGVQVGDQSPLDALGP